MRSFTIKNSVQFYAKTAGIVLIISLIAGGFGEMFVFSHLVVPDNATVTANNIINSNFLFHLGFASYLIEAVCDVTLTWLMYLLLKPVNKNLATLSIFFGIVSTATFAFAELFYAAVPLILKNTNLLKTFSVNQVNALALLSLKIYGYGGEIFMVFYGITTGLRGYLIFKSGYLPRFVGILLLIGGLCFILKNFAVVLIPVYASDLLLVPLMLGMLTLTIWLLLKGVNNVKWKESLNKHDLQGI